jgi:formylglycine-generating enzyme required for sulfatase activity/dienelactone hydrolase
VVGQKLSHYEIIAKLGEGGMGIVYKARDVELGRLVAIKIFPGATLPDEHRRRRFVQEARAASALNHPDIVTIHEIGHADGLDFIVMEYVDGRPLKALIGERLPVKEAVTYARQIAGALAAAHASGIIHRDIKPANVMVTAAGVVKVLDFGLAKFVEHSSLSDTDPTVTSGPTQRGEVVGTTAYMSPEQAEGKTVDARSDVFSLGIVLYEMLSGCRPFRGDSALATMVEIMRAAPPPLENVGEELARIVRRAMEKDREARYRAADMEGDLGAYLESLSAPRASLHVLGSRLKWPVIAAVAVLASAGAWMYQRGAKVRWAREVAIPEIARLAEQGKFVAAFDMATEAEKHISGDPGLMRLWSEISQTPPVDTVPAQADVYIQEYGVGDSGWRYVGKSPIRDVRIPNGFFRWKTTKEGFEPSYGVGGAHYSVHSFQLDLAAPAQPGMVYVQSGTVNVSLLSVGALGPYPLPRYAIDQYEVTNRAFKEFVDKGGYQKKEYWKQPFRKGKRTLSREEALAEFHDSTGRPGPATWEAGAYREGTDDEPVSGVSWFEAAAYAEFVGKQLPTIYHWYRAADPRTVPYVGSSSNFGGRGPRRVGTSGAPGPFGTQDMAGNVKEWCWNETEQGDRFILGGSWKEAAYAFVNPDALSPFDRSAGNGFRCMRATAAPTAELLAPRRREFRDYNREKPVSEDAFRVVRSLYATASGELSARVESVDDSSPQWRKEKVSFQAAYRRQRVPAYLFVPKGFRPPYQVVVYVPGAGSLATTSSAILELPRFDFIIRSGRAVLHPVLPGMYERHDPAAVNWYLTPRHIAIESFQDIVRSVDYLESRSDMDAKKIGYAGTSMGSRMASIFLSMEDRFRVATLFDGGFHLTSKPVETDEPTFAPRVKVPVLMINGRYDYTFPLEASQKQMFRWLGTPAQHKRHVILDSSHDVNQRRAEAISETLKWLDKYLGPASR